MDDIIVASCSSDSIFKFGRELSARFDIKDVESVNFCLGIKFDQNKGQVTLIQAAYVDELLERFRMTDATPVTTPMDVNTKLINDADPNELDDDVPYRELVGCLTYLALATLPEIAYAASCLGQFNNCYGRAHWTAAKHVLRYLKGTKSMELNFSKDPRPLREFVESDWGNCPNDPRSYSGYVFLLGGCPISWESQKQRTVALNSIEAEYMSLTEGAKELIYLTKLLQELGFPELLDPVLFVDNYRAVKLAENPIFHGRSKHIDIRHHLVRQHLQENHLRLAHVPTEDNIADLFTKALARTRMTELIRLAGLFH